MPEVDSHAYRRVRQVDVERTEYRLLLLGAVSPSFPVRRAPKSGVGVRHVSGPPPCHNNGSELLEQPALANDPQRAEDLEGRWPLLRGLEEQDRPLVCVIRPHPAPDTEGPRQDLEVAAPGWPGDAPIRAVPAPRIG